MPAEGEDEDQCTCERKYPPIGIFLLIAGLTMVVCSSWQMFAAAGAVAVGCMALQMWGYIKGGSP
jgi:hypothetical protein